MANCRSGIAKTADGAFHMVQGVSHWGSLQDVALLQMAPRSPKLDAVAAAHRLQPPAKVWVGVGQKGAEIVRGRDAQGSALCAQVDSIKAGPGESGSEGVLGAFKGVASRKCFRG